MIYSRKVQSSGGTFEGSRIHVLEIAVTKVVINVATWSWHVNSIMAWNRDMYKATPISRSCRN
jgi:hypothetical protein